MLKSLMRALPGMALVALAACASSRPYPVTATPTEASKDPVDEFAAAARFSGQLLPPEGGDLFVATAGDGPAVVFLHQFDGSHEAWAPIGLELLHHHRVILVDLPGRGHSPGGDGRFFGNAQAAQQVSKALRYLRVDKVALIGASTGAHVALRVAAANPGQVHTLIVMGGFAGMTPEAEKLSHAPGCEDNPPEFWADQRRRHAGGEQQAHAIAHQLCQEADNPEVTTPFDVAPITARTLVIQGDHDPLFPPRVGLELQQGIKGAWLWVVPGTNHLPCFRPDRHAECAAVIAAFLDGSPPSR
jgi:pimeloyl-ACP methyl ester carboxylesterase